MKKLTAYHNFTILEGSGLQLRDNAFLVIEDNLIIEIGSGTPDESTDLCGALVFPSFVDAHTHIADSIVKEGGIGLPTEEAVSPPDGLKYRCLRELSPEELKISLASAIDELLINGITAFADFREGGTGGVAALKEVAAGKPIEAVIFGEPDFPLGSDNYLMEASPLLKSADGMGIGDIAGYSKSALSTLMELHEKEGKRLAVHVAETNNAQQRCLETWGKSEVERALEFNPALFIHFTNPVSGDLDLARKSRIPIVCCSRTNCIIADGIPPFGEFIKMNLPLALGTDNMMFTSPDMFREMDWFSRLARGESGRADAVSPKEVLSIATLGGARSLGLETKLGSLEEGKAASFIALDSNSINLRGIRNIHSAIVHRAGPSDIQLIVSWGKEVFKKF